MRNKIAVVVTSHGHYDGHDRATGLWLSELVHFWDVLEPAGFDFDLISPKGGKSPLEPKSLKGFTYDKATQRRHEDASFMARLDDTVPASDVSWQDYDAVYYTGGHGVMYDFRGDKYLDALSRDLFESGRVVSAVCHGYCALLDTKLSVGDYLIEYKAMTGFTWFEERLSGVHGIVPYNAEQVAKDRGANFDKGFVPLMSHVNVDGTLVTGQNPMSATETAEKTLEAIRRAAAKN
jgi:putative intracellular protease/amidase